MFNTKKFLATPATPIVIGNNVHSVLQYTNGPYLKIIPSKKERFQGIFYLELKCGKIVTYREDDESLQLHDISLTELKRRVKEDLPLKSVRKLHYVDKRKNKYIGNDILNMLEKEKVI